MYHTLRDVLQQLKKKDSEEPSGGKPLTIAELYGLMVVECNVAPDYFLYQMKYREVSAVIDAYNERVKRELVEQRKNWYYTLLPYAEQGFKETDIMQFTWDESPAEAVDIDSEEVQRRIEYLNNQA